ncbi:MAG: MBL fold metallo-hydrolase [Candidatus Kryptoniota bacterium]
MLIEKFEDGPIWTTGYLLYDPDSLEALVIDVPLWSSDKIYKRIRELNLNVKFIIATHGHWDHIGEMKKLRALTGAKVSAHQSDEPMLRDPNGMLIPPPLPIEPVSMDVYVNHGAMISFGKFDLEVIHTPGHSAGSICLYEEKEGILFTGDTLFSGSIGRTDLPSGSYEEISKSISTKLMSLPDNVKIFPGHGADSTLKKEREENQFVQMMFEEK